jgi:Ni,Fe-hydrogenase III large subunit
MTERLEHMARAAEDLAEECSKRSTILLRMKESGHVDMARIALIFHGLASILRASGDPSQTLREEDFQ